MMKNIADIFPLSPMQQGMLFHSQLDPESGVYVEQVTCILKGELDSGAFTRAWERVVNRHPILRAAFVSPEGKEPVQVVYRSVSPAIRQEDWSALDVGAQHAKLAEFLRAERTRGFDFAAPPLMRLALFRLAPTAWQFVWTYHHILLDGWSTPVVFQEVMAFYQAFAQDRDLALEMPRGYRDYILWLKRQDMNRAEEYWRERLKGFSAPTPLSSLQPQGHAFDSQHDSDQPSETNDREIWLPADQVQLLQSAARQHRVTLNTLVNAAWALLLSRFSADEEICYGVTVSGRPPDLPDAEQIVGLFINTLPVRVRVDAHQKVSDFLSELQAQFVEMRQYEYTPLVDIHRWSGVPGHLSLFETILVYENYPIQALIEQPGQQDSLTIEDVQSVEKTNYPLTAVAGLSGELMLKIVYDNTRFSWRWIGQLLDCWAALLCDLASRPEAPIGSLSLLTSAERQRILFDWNQTRADFPSDCCAHQLFETQAANTPTAVALDFEGETVSYAELNRRANQLAHYLVHHTGLVVGSRVGLCLERSPEMISAILAVMKAGCAYVPLDPAYPANRLAYMLEDSHVQLLLTSRRLIDHISPGEAAVVALDELGALIAQGPEEDLSLGLTPDTLAYIIYTSGSTGRPKGVLLEHRGLCNLSAQYRRAIDIGPGDRMLQFFSYSFDGSVADIFVALTSGATLCMGRPESLMPGPELVRFLRERRVTHGMVTPSALAALPHADLPGLRVLLTGGKPARAKYSSRGPSAGAG
jgi:non-ribosomal peptide synthetase component F